MKLDIKSPAWKTIYRLIAETDEDMLLAYFTPNGSKTGKPGIANYLRCNYDIDIQTNEEGHWLSVDIKDTNIITILLLKYEGENNEID